MASWRTWQAIRRPWISRSPFSPGPANDRPLPRSGPLSATRYSAAPPNNSSRTGSRRDLVAGVDEHIRNGIERVVSDLLLRREQFTESDYLQYVVRTIVSIGERGGAVILGRGAQFILAPERALRVLIVAPREARIERLAKQESLDHRAASARLANEDAGRREFLQHHFKRDPDDPSQYDLSLNLGTLSLEVATDSLIDTLSARFPAAAAHLAKSA